MNLRRTEGGVAVVVAVAVIFNGLPPDARSRFRAMEFGNLKSTFAWINPAASQTQASDFGIKSYDLALRIDPWNKRISGRARLKVLATSDELRTILVDMADTLIVVSIQSESHAIPYLHQDSHLWVGLPRAYKAGSSVEVTVDYESSRPGSGLAFDEHESTPMIYSYGLPFTAQQWFPCKDAPNAKAESATIAITVPTPLVAASNGRLVRTTTNSDGTTTFYWHVRYPIYPDMISVAVTNYATFTLPYYYNNSSKAMPMAFYVYPEDLEKAQKQFAILPEIMKHYSAMFGEYPFIREKYGVAEFAKASFREHQTLPSFSAKLVTGGREYDWILAHELAHQWFGNCVSVKTWSHIWLNEGFANYAYALWQENTKGEVAYLNVMRNWDKDEFPGSVFIKDTSNKNALFSETTFQKGAWVLHMLRHVMGDQAFFDALRAYVKAYAYGAASTEDFQFVCEKVYGGSLDWFFKEWIYGVNRPIYQYKWQATQNESGNTVNLEISQVQPNPEVFVMPIDVFIETAQGQKEFVVWQKSRSQTFTFAVDRPPSRVELDPDGWILKKVQPSEPLTAKVNR